MLRPKTTAGMPYSPGLEIQEYLDCRRFFPVDEHLIKQQCES